MKTLWSNKVVLPIEWMKARSLHLALPLFEKGVLKLDTRFGYEVKDLENYMDGFHTRTVYAKLLGFGLVFETRWNSDGRIK